MKRKPLFLVALLLLLDGLLTGCATPLVTYSAQGKNVVYNQGVGTLSEVTRESRILIAPTFVYQNEADPPTFTLSVTNTSRRTMDVNPVKIQAFLDDQPAHVYSLEERVQEIRTNAARQQAAIAMLGAATAAASAYDAAHATSTSTVPGAPPATTQTYDPTAGVLAGVSALKDTDNSIKQIQNAAGNEEKVAAAIFVHNTLFPRHTAVGQIVIKQPGVPFTKVRIVVPDFGNARKTQEFVFVREKHEQ